MTVAVKIKNESTGNESPYEFIVEFLTEEVDVREIIRSRVYQEVMDYNQKQPEYFRGLIQPSGAESTLNGYRMKKKVKIDWKVQFEKAIEAFEQNKVLVIIDDRQVESLDQKVTLTPDTCVSFIKLVFLVGG